MVSGMASITLVNYPFSRVANIPLRRVRIIASLRLQDLDALSDLQPGANHDKTEEQSQEQNF
jgi:hypothetical protein